MQKQREINKQINEYLDYCQFVMRVSNSTIHAKKQAYRLFLGATDINRLEDLTNQMVNQWVAGQVARGNKARTINGRLDHMVTLVKWARDMGIIIPNFKLSLVIKQKEEPPRRVYFTEEQVEKALAFADRREWLQIRLCFDCGLRLSELRKLRLCDITGRQITVLGKGSKQRFVIMSEEVRARLDDWIYCEHITNYLWPSRRYPGKPICNTDIRDKMKRPFLAAGLSSFHPHALRHSFATDLQKHGAPVGQIKVALGHANESTTERYIHALDSYDVAKIWQQYKYSPNRACVY